MNSMEKRTASESVDAEDRARKRRKQSATKYEDVNGKSSVFMLDAQKLLDLILRRKDRTRLIHKEFRTLPNRSSYPDYYEEIKYPIALSDIQNKLAIDQYSSLDDLKKDLILMCENAKEYNEPKSQIYKDAIILRKTVDEFVETEPEKPMPILTSNGDGRRMAAVRRTGSTVAAPEAVPSRKMEAAMMSIVDDLLSITDEASGDILFEDFRNLVNRKQYPEYYKVIKEPMSLNTIRKRLLAHKYPGWPEFERDLNLIVTNAESFNEEDSEIVMTARELRNRFEQRLIKERGPLPPPEVSANSGSGIKLRLNVKAQTSPQLLPIGNTPKLKLTYRRPADPAAVPVPPKITAAPVQTPVTKQLSQGPPAKLPNGSNASHPNGVAVNGSGNDKSLKKQSQETANGLPPVRVPKIPKIETPQTVQETLPKLESSIPLTPEASQQADAENKPVPNLTRKSPVESARHLTPRRTTRTPVPTGEADSITVIPRTKQPSPSGSHLSPPHEVPARWKSVTPGDQPATPAPSAPTSLPALGPNENRTTLSPAAAAQSQPMTASTSSCGPDPRFRAPGKGIEDALISNLTIATHPNLNLEDLVEYSFAAHPTKAFQNQVVFFTAEQSILLISLALGHSLQNRPYTATITVNGHRLFFNNLQPNPNRRRDDSMILTCDVRLIPGKVAHIEVAVIAGQRGGKIGIGEQEHEKFTVDAFLQYE